MAMTIGEAVEILDEMASDAKREGNQRKSEALLTGIAAIGMIADSAQLSDDEVL